MNEWNIELSLQLTGGTCRLFYGYTFVFHGFALYRYINFLFILKNLSLGTYGGVFYKQYSINKIHLIIKHYTGWPNLHVLYILVLLCSFSRFLRFQTSYKYINMHGRFITINKIRLSLYP